MSHNSILLPFAQSDFGEVSSPETRCILDTNLVLWVGTKRAHSIAGQETNTAHLLVAAVKVVWPSVQQVDGLNCVVLPSQKWFMVDRGLLWVDAAEGKNRPNPERNANASFGPLFVNNDLGIMISLVHQISLDLLQVRWTWIQGFPWGPAWVAESAESRSIALTAVTNLHKAHGKYA